MLLCFHASKAEQSVTAGDRLPRAANRVAAVLASDHFFGRSGLNQAESSWPISLIKRDRVRKLVIDEAVEIDNPAYKYAETYICSLIALAPVTSLMAFLKFAFSSRHLEKRDGEFSFSENDPKRIVDACNEATAQFTGMMILNSPLLTLVLLLIALALWIRGGINRDAIFKKCEWYARSLRQPIDQHDLLSNLGCT